MCMQCVGAVGTALQAATVVGGPIAYAGYRRIRARLGLSDTSVSAVEAAQAAGAAGITPAPTSAAIASTASSENWVPAQRRHSARASSISSGSW